MQQVYSVNMTLPLMVASDNISTALAQSDLITQGDLAISGLSDAVAAGLIAGQHCTYMRSKDVLHGTALCAISRTYSTVDNRLSHLAF